MLRVAFKEWAAVCRALADGRQALILRKGGIAEEGGVFRPEHERFWLYPTHFHEQQQKGLKPEASAGLDEATPGVVRLSAFVEVARTWFVDRLDDVLALDPFHVWTGETVCSRFRYKTAGVYVFAVRVWRLGEAVEVPELPEYIGCKTWVELDRAVPTDGATPALSDEAYAGVVGRVAEVL